MDVCAEQIPPELEQVLEVSSSGRRTNLLGFTVKVLTPRLVGTDKMSNFYSLAKPVKDRNHSILCVFNFKSLSLLFKSRQVGVM